MANNEVRKFLGITVAFLAGAVTTPEGLVQIVNQDTFPPQVSPLQRDIPLDDQGISLDADLPRKPEVFQQEYTLYNRVNTKIRP